MLSRNTKHYKTKQKTYHVPYLPFIYFKLLTLHHKHHQITNEKIKCLSFFFPYSHRKFNQIHIPNINFIHSTYFTLTSFKKKLAKKMKYKTKTTKQNQKQKSKNITNWLQTFSLIYPHFNRPKKTHITLQTEITARQ